MNPTDQSLDTFLSANTGGLTVKLTNGKTITGTVTRAAAYNAGTVDDLLLIVDESVSSPYAAPHTRRWFLDVQDVVSLTT